MRVELPQCPVCINALTPAVKAVASSQCGHVICSDCSSRCFPTKRSGACPVCRATSNSGALLNLFLGFGEQDTELICIERGTPSLETLTEAVSSLSSSRLSRARKIVARLEASVLDALQLSLPNKSTETNMSFIQTGNLLHRIADSIGECEQKNILYSIGDVITSMRDLYDRLFDVLRQNSLLKEQLKEAETLKTASLSDVQETTRLLQIEYNRLKIDKEERERDLTQRIQAVKEEYRNEEQLRKLAESRLDGLEAEIADLKKKVMRDRKKIILARQDSNASNTYSDASTSNFRYDGRQRHHRPRSDSGSSLQLEEPEQRSNKEEIEIEVPPSSAPTASSSGSTYISTQSQDNELSHVVQKLKRPPKFKAPQKEPLNDFELPMLDDDTPLEDILNAPASSLNTTSNDYSSQRHKPVSNRAVISIPKMPVPSSRKAGGRDPMLGSPKKKARMFVAESSAID